MTISSFITVLLSQYHLMRPFFSRMCKVWFERALAAISSRSDDHIDFFQCDFNRRANVTVILELVFKLVFIFFLSFKKNQHWRI